MANVAVLNMAGAQVAPGCSTVSGKPETGHTEHKNTR